ncbi:hypothetical protein D3C77_275040 [compost metagenome]
MCTGAVVAEQHDVLRLGQHGRHGFSECFAIGFERKRYALDPAQVVAWILFVEMPSSQVEGNFAGRQVLLQLFNGPAHAGA